MNFNSRRIYQSKHLSTSALAFFRGEGLDYSYPPPGPVISNVAE